MGGLVKAMYGTPDAPQIRPNQVRREMCKMGFKPSVLHPSECYTMESEMYVLVHVGDLFCAAPWSELEALYAPLKHVYGFKNTVVRGGTEGEVLEQGGPEEGRWGRAGSVARNT